MGGLNEEIKSLTEERESMRSFFLGSSARSVFRIRVLVNLLFDSELVRWHGSFFFGGGGSDGSSLVVADVVPLRTSLVLMRRAPNHRD